MRMQKERFQIACYANGADRRKDRVMSEDSDAARLLDSFSENHRGIIIEAAHEEDVIWTNTCNIYKIPEDKSGALRRFIRHHYHADGNPISG